MNAALRYTIVSGNENSEFTVNASSGDLSTTISLDYERNSLFVILVSVSDMNGGYGGFEDLAAVQINVKVRSA